MCYNYFSQRCYRCSITGLQDNLIKINKLNHNHNYCNRSCNQDHCSDHNHNKCESNDHSHNEDTHHHGHDHNKPTQRQKEPQSQPGLASDHNNNGPQLGWIARPQPQLQQAQQQSPQQMKTVAVVMMRVSSNSESDSDVAAMVMMRAQRAGGRHLPHVVHIL